MFSKNDQFFFALVYLLPLIPALALTLALGRSGFAASVEGTWAGFGIQAGGGFAAYVVLVFLLAFVRQHVAPAASKVTAEIYVRIDGEPDIVSRFLSNEARHVQLFLSHNGIPVSRLSDFFVSKTALITTTDAIDPDLINGRAQIDLNLDGTKSAKLITTKTQAATRMTVEIEIQGDPDNVRARLDSQEISYASDFDGVRVRGLMLLANQGDVPTNSVYLGSTQFFRPFARYKSVLRKITSPQDIKIAIEVLSSWTKNNLSGKDADQIGALFDSSWTQLEKLGNAIGRFERQEWGIKSDESFIRDGSLELMWGLTPRLTNIPDGLRKDQFLLYIVDYSVTDSGKPIQKGDKDTTGTITRYETDNLILIGKSLNNNLSGDRDALTLRIQSSRREATFDVLDPPGAKTRVLYVESVPRLTEAELPVRFE